MRTRKLIAMAAAAALVSLTSCSAGSGKDSGVTNSGKDSGVTHLTYFSWDTQQLMSPLIAKFEQENPQIKIDFSFAPPAAAYNSALQKRLLGKTAADVFMIDGENRGDLIDGAFVTDLTGKPFMKPVMKLDDYARDGKTYGMSLFSWGAGIVYNQDLLKKVGASAPPSDLGAFAALSAHLKAAGIPPLYEHLNDTVSYLLSAMVGAHFAAQSSNPDAAIFSGKSSFVSEWTAPLTAYQDLYKSGSIPNSNVSVSEQDQLNAFTNGTVAMIVTGPWDFATIKSAAPNMKFGFSAVPSATGSKQYVAGSSGPAYAINSKAKNRDAAEKWLTFLSSPEGVQLYNQQLGAIMTTDNFAPKVDPVLSPLVDAIRSGRDYWPVIGWQRDQNALSTTLIASTQQLLLGQLTPEQVAQRLDDKLKAGK